MQHVLDCNNGYMMLAKNYIIMVNIRCVEFSTNSSNYTVKKICKEFSKNINFKFFIHQDIKKKILNKFDKSRYLLKWKTQLGFQEMID